MLKEQFDRLSDEQKALISVSYLLSHPDIRPEESQKLFKKLEIYDKNAQNIQEAINQAKKSINELRPKFEQVVGAITAISSVIADTIPEDKIEGYCLSFELPENTNSNIAPVISKNNDAPDFAGATAKQLDDPLTKE